MRYQAILFDCDGTLVDSERIGNEVIIEQVAELGLQLTLEEALHQFAGRKMADTITLIEQMLGRAVPAPFLPELRRRMAVAFESRLQAMDGVHELLQSLTSTLCVVSNGPQDKMRVSLGVTGLLPYFDGRIYSGYDCDSWKPDPGLFLYAARCLGVDPERCAVVEDSLHGVIGGMAAGMTVFAYAPDHSHRLAATGARIFHHMTELQMELQEART